MGRRGVRFLKAATSSVNWTALIAILSFSGMILFFAHQRDSDEVAQIALGVVGTAFGVFIVNLAKGHNGNNGKDDDRKDDRNNNGGG